MSRVQIKTDNSHFEVKIALRMAFLPETTSIKILDCFAGEQRIWTEIKLRNPNRRFEITSIDKKTILSNKIYLQGDNMKFLPNFDLDDFDIIDLDAYGIGFEILDYCLKHSTKPVIILTYIQSFFGMLPIRFLEAIGYNRVMVKKIPMLFCRDAFGKLRQYLSMNSSVGKICWYDIERKYYIAIIRKNEDRS